MLDKLFKENKLKKWNFIITKISINDILLRKKRINQKVTFEIIQQRLHKEDFMLEKKKEIPRTKLFRADELEIWETKVYAIEPNTYTTDDCITCDWHWELSCPTCMGTWEEKCFKCNWKTQIKQTRNIPQSVNATCPTCKWAWSISGKCQNCKGMWNIKVSTLCLSCRWKKQIQKGINPQTNKPVFWPCQSCMWRGSVISQKSCQACGWNWSFSRSCWKCNWKGNLTITKNNTQVYYTPCKFCNQTGKIRCRICQGNQVLTCPTCKGERRTLQYEFNKFLLKVTPTYQLIWKDTLLDDAIWVIDLAPSKKLDFLLTWEKEKLQAAVVKMNIKISPKTVSRVKGVLYDIKDKKTWVSYYIFETNNLLFYNILPPSSTLESYGLAYYIKLKKWWKKFKFKYIDKFFNHITNRREY